MPAQTLGAYPSFKDRIKHVFVVLRENRSFDHYLGDYRRPGDDKRRRQHQPLDDDSDVTNYDPSTFRDVARFHTKQYCADETTPDHEWNGSHLQFNNGRLDGFAAASASLDNKRAGEIAMGYFTREDLPFYYWLADNFAISESYFASLLGPTMANISFYYNATACGTTENVSTTLNGVVSRIPWFNHCTKGNSIFDVLAAHGVSAQVYNDSEALLDSGAIGLTSYNPLDLKRVEDFAGDLDKEEREPGTLAEVVFIEPNYGHLNALPGFNKLQNDEHPPTNVQVGQYFTYDIISTLLAHPSVFASSVVFISWDENGGFYDHVVPPTACAPDDFQPDDFDFKRYGFRVPFFAVSPYARKNFASGYTADHTSILRFIEAWQDLPALTNRDANAWPLLDMFDFDREPRTDFSELTRPCVNPCPPPEVP